MVNVPINQLDTPCLILDKNKLQNNISTMKQHLNKLGTKLRPHVKTTKSIDITKLIFNGETGPITVSTLKEAEHFAAGGFTDILYAVGIVPNKLPRVKSLIDAGVDLKIILDSTDVAKAACDFAFEHKTPLKIYIEIDCDNHRAGLSPDDEKIMSIAQMLDKAESITFMGFLTHAGESYNCASVDELKKHAKLEREEIIKCVETVSKLKIEALTSIGSSPTAKFSENMSGIDEVRAGIFVLQDLVQAGLGTCTVDDIALSVLTTIIGHKPEHNRLIIDAGALAISKDRGTASQKTDCLYGLVCDAKGKAIDGFVVEAVNQEHGLVTSNNGAIDFESYPVGSQLRILPNHACMTAAGYGEYHVIDGNNVSIARWQRCNGW